LQIPASQQVRNGQILIYFRPMQAYAITPNLEFFALFGCGFLEKRKPNNRHAENSSIGKRYLHHFICKCNFFCQRVFWHIRAAEFALILGEINQNTHAKPPEIPRDILERFLLGSLGFAGVVALAVALLAGGSAIAKHPLGLPPELGFSFCDRYFNGEIFAGFFCCLASSQSRSSSSRCMDAHSITNPKEREERLP
jgi:hypothetical protein